MENELNIDKYKTLYEYGKEWQETGGNDFLEFLHEKLQEARESGNEKLVAHIETILKGIVQNQNIFDEMLQIEAEQEERRKEHEPDDSRYTSNEESSGGAQGADGFLGADPRLLGLIEERERELEEIKAKIENFKKNPGKFSRYIALHSDKENRNAEIEYLKEKARMQTYKVVRMGITQMTPEEVAEEYLKLLSERQRQLDMDANGITVSQRMRRFVEGCIEMIELYYTSSPIVKQKEDSVGQEHLVENQEAERKGNAPFEGREGLESLTLEELQKKSDGNEKNISVNEEEIQERKQVLINKILGQQQIIARQQQEIDRLKSLKEL